ncbi:MAG: HAD-IIB family hydrolase [Cyanobacteria bacterium REEB65]|nr:HAD-IIB family hydrolase [Cyanobacteria bacterium REEB65]
MVFPGARMLVCDLDGTLVEEDVPLLEFLAWLEPRRASIRLVYNTGRSAASSRLLLASTALPRPDALVTGLGTAIAFADDQDVAFERTDPQWHGIVSRGWRGQDVEEVTLSFVPRIVPQPLIAQTDLKKSFVVHDPEAVQPLVEALVRADLQARWIQTGPLLDIIPPDAGKHRAVIHLQRQFCVQPGDTVTCGDSANDLEMLQGEGHAIVVGNASAELLAKVGERAIRARAAGAAGVLEGLRHLGW